MSQNRLKILDGIKFIACMGIFVGHFLGAFYNFCEVKPDMSPYILKIINSPLKIFIDAPLLLNIFYIISGYLASLKEIHSLRYLLLSLIKRYFRFFVPILIINLIVYIMTLANWFHTIEVGTLLTNSWVTSYYSMPLDLAVTIRESLRLGSGLNGPLWTLRPLFLGTCFIYVYKYMLSKFPALYCNITALAVINFLNESNVIENFQICMICFLGVVLQEIWKLKDANSPRYTIYVLLMLILEVGLHPAIYMYIGSKVTVSELWAFNQNWVILYAFLITCFARRSDLFSTIFENKYVYKLSKLSFGVYVVHWPLVCSFSLALYMRLSSYFSYSKIFVINLFLSTIVILLCSYVYTFIVDMVDSFFSKVLVWLNKAGCYVLKTQ